VRTSLVTRLGNWRRRARSFRRTRLHPVWEELRWPTIGGLAVLALVLGILGFRRYLRARYGHYHALDPVYLSTQLFVFEWGSTPVRLNWELEVSRFLAPAVAVYTAAGALAAIFRDQLQSLRVRVKQQHVVICGLGRKGLLLAEGFQRDGDRVVAIEENEQSDRIPECRDLGVPVVVGDATEPLVLERARVWRARTLVCVCGEDAANAEIAARARELVARKKGDLTAFLHIVDVELADLLARRASGGDASNGFRLEFFNIFERGAQAWLARHPPFEPGTVKPHLLVIGVGQMGHHLVLGAARDWLAANPVTETRLRLTMLDRAARLKQELLCLRYPRLTEACHLTPLELEVPSPLFEAAEFLFDDGDTPVSCIYVCLDNESLALATGLKLLQRLRERPPPGEQPVPIVVRMTRGGGLPALLGDSEGLSAFGVLDETCTPALLLASARTGLA
jgi:hypothetical protein